jgi:hypothetical protein
MDQVPRAYGLKLKLFEPQRNERCKIGLIVLESGLLLGYVEKTWYIGHFEYTPDDLRVALIHPQLF